MMLLNIISSCSRALSSTDPTQVEQGLEKGPGQSDRPPLLSSQTRYRRLLRGVDLGLGQRDDLDLDPAIERLVHVVASLDAELGFAVALPAQARRADAAADQVVGNRLRAPFGQQLVR